MQTLQISSEFTKQYRYARQSTAFSVLVCSYPFADFDKKSFSASELQRQLGHSTYNPIWAMLHKLRLAMGKRDAEYTLKEVVELDEASFLPKHLKTRKVSR